MSDTGDGMVWDALVAVVSEILDEIGEDPGELTRDTLLVGDLGLSSVEAIHIAIMLENRLRVALDFEKLAVRDGDYVEDLSLGTIQDFVAQTVAADARRG